jgi:hypothetical protein
MHEIRSAYVPGEGVRKQPLVATKKNRRADDKKVGASLAAVPVKREESRLTDTRAADRLRDAVESATITFRRRKYEVPVINVSPGGAMIESELDPRIGERLDIQFADCNRTRCSVRWVRGGRIGLEFEEETTILGSAKVRSYVYGAQAGQIAAPTGQDASRKLIMREPRQGLIWTGILYWSFEAFTVRIRNISGEGVMLECEKEIQPGAQVRLNIAEAGTMAGEVRWSRGGQLGIKFEQRFDLRLLAQTRPSASPDRPGVVKPDYLKSDGHKNSPWFAAWDRLTPEDLES